MAALISIPQKSILDLTFCGTRRNKETKMNRREGRELEGFEGINYRIMTSHLDSLGFGHRKVRDVDFPVHPLSDADFPVIMLGFDQFSYGFVHVATSESWNRREGRELEGFEGINYRIMTSHLDSLGFGHRKVRDVDFPVHPLSDADFPVIMLGFDQFSYGFVHVATSESWNSYSDFSSNLRSDYNQNGVLVPYDEISVGMFVIAKVRRGTYVYYIRAEVVNKYPSSQAVGLFDLDDVAELVVPAEQVYFANFSAQMQPIRAVKFILEDMGLYRDTNMVQQGFKQLTDLEDDGYRAEVIPSSDPNPKIRTLRLITHLGDRLASLIGSNIVACCRQW